MTTNQTWQLTEEELLFVGDDPNLSEDDLFGVRDYEREVEDKYSYGGHCDLLESAFQGDIKTFERTLKEYRIILMRSHAERRASNDEDYLHVDVYGTSANEILLASIERVIEDSSVKPRVVLFDCALEAGLSAEEAKVFSAKASRVSGSKRLKKLLKASTLDELSSHKVIINASTSVSSILRQIKTIKGYIPQHLMRGKKLKPKKAELTHAKVQEAKRKGFNQKDTALSVGISLSTVKRHWN